MVSHNHIKAAIPLFLVMFIDGVGVSLLFPILNGIIVEPANSILAAGTSDTMRNFAYGGVLAIFMLCWFIGAPVISGLSDGIGRKKALLIALIGASVGYLLSGIAVLMQSYVLLIVGRMISGLTSGSQPVAQAAMIDLSSKENKAFYIALILLVLSLAIVVGPIIGGVLSDSDIVSWFNFTTPLYFVALLSVMNLILLSVFFQETKVTTDVYKFKITDALNYFIDAFKHPSIRYLSVVFLLLILGWSAFFNYIDLFLDKIFRFSNLQISIYLGLLGVGLVIGFGFLVNLVTKYFALSNIVIVNSIICGLLVALGLVFVHPDITWILAIPIGLTNALAYSICITLFSNEVDESKQGWVMGVTGAIMPLAFAITSVLGAILASFTIFSILWFAVACLSLTGGLLYLFVRRGVVVLSVSD